MNQLSFIKIKFNSTQYDFKTLYNIAARNDLKGNYTGMINKTSGLASGFGRYYISSTYVYDGQFYEGKFHGVVRYIKQNFNPPNGMGLEKY